MGPDIPRNDGSQEPTSLLRWWTQESYNHHKSSVTDRKKSHVQAMMKFIKEKWSHMSPDACQTLTKGEQKYLTLRNKRFSEKTRISMHRMHRTNLKTMSSVRSNGQKTVKKVVKEINIVGRIANRTRSSSDNGRPLELTLCLLLCCLMRTKCLTKPTKRVLIKEMETHLKPEDYYYVHVWRLCVRHVF